MMEKLKLCRMFKREANFLVFAVLIISILSYMALFSSGHKPLPIGVPTEKTKCGPRRRHTLYSVSPHSDTLYSVSNKIT